MLRPGYVSSDEAHPSRLSSTLAESRCPQYRLSRVLPLCDVARYAALPDSASVALASSVVPIVSRVVTPTGSAMLPLGRQITLPLGQWWIQNKILGVTV
jgi:hypothetical protein